MKFLIKIFTLKIIICAFSVLGYAQIKSINLDEVIYYSQTNSLQFKTADFQKDVGFWSYQTYKNSFLPFLYLEGNLPIYNRSINTITLPNGEDAFVSQNQANTNLKINLKQNVGLTGGTINFSTSLNRLDVFGTQRQVNYFAVPFSITYQQDYLGYNRFKWQKRIEPLKMQLNDKQFITDMEKIALTAVDTYFEMLHYQNKQILSKELLKNTNKIYEIAQARFEFGTVSQGELLQLKLNLINIKNEIYKDSLNFISSRLKLNNLINQDKNLDTRLQIPEKIDHFYIDPQEALVYAKENNIKVIELVIKGIESEQNLALTKSETKPIFKINANLGVSNKAQELNNLFNRFENQQFFSLGISLPLLDWGLVKSKEKMALSNFELIKSQKQQNDLEIDQEVLFIINKWNLQSEQQKLAKESYEISTENYQYEVNRFIKGAISVNDLNLAQAQYNNSTINYIESLRSFWSLYYNIRMLTLYDFKNKRFIRY